MSDYNSRIFNKVMDDVLDIRDDEQSNHIGSEVEDLYIEVDNIISAFGEPLIAADIFNQIGNLSFLYTRIVHPILSELIDGCRGDLDRLNNIYKDDDIANLLVDRLENRIWLVRSTDNNRNRNTVIDADIVKLCVVLIEELAPHIAQLSTQAQNRIQNQNDVPADLTITERATSELIPNARNPNLLLVRLEYCWVYK